MSLQEYCPACGELLPRSLFEQEAHFRACPQAQAVENAVQSTEDDLPSPFQTARDESVQRGVSVSDVLAERRLVPFVVRDRGLEE
jgi:hypothetical protein